MREHVRTLRRSGVYLSKILCARLHEYFLSCDITSSSFFLFRGPIGSDDQPPRGGSGAGSLGGAQQLTGGGVVAEIFRDLQKPSRFSGGGVVADIFRGLQEPSRFSGGG